MGYGIANEVRRKGAGDDKDLRPARVYFFN